MGRFGKFVLWSGFAAVFSLAALASIGSNVQSEFEQANVRDELAVAENTATASSQSAIDPMESASPPSLSPATKPQRVNYDDLDDADKAIRLAINRKGYLCAKPIEVVTVGPSLYGVGCITNRNGTGRSNYLVNASTGSVKAI